MVGTSGASTRVLAPDPADARAVRVLAGGAFDRSSCHQLTTAVRGALSVGSPHIVVDVEHVTLMDSASIRALLACRGLALAAGGSLRVANDSGIVARVLDITDARRLLCPPDSTDLVAAVRPAPQRGPLSADSAQAVVAEVIRTSESLLGHAYDLVAVSRELMNRLAANRNAGGTGTPE
ncbi:STAS domain-containing protein [Actinoplanes sp. CA-030573]|uniref:STAS domain-containing protein n=1 Tax=Actinoplanes sp. CA-030573 TaxID=3239898 RepID=UPI003D8C10B8